MFHLKRCVILLKACFSWGYLRYLLVPTHPRGKRAHNLVRASEIEKYFNVDVTRLLFNPKMFLWVQPQELATQAGILGFSGRFGACWIWSLICFVPWSWTLSWLGLSAHLVIWCPRISDLCSHSLLYMWAWTLPSKPSFCNSVTRTEVIRIQT